MFVEASHFLLKYIWMCIEFILLLHSNLIEACPFILVIPNNTDCASGYFGVMLFAIRVCQLLRGETFSICVVALYMDIRMLS